VGKREDAGGAAGRGAAAALRGPSPDFEVTRLRAQGGFRGAETVFTGPGIGLFLDTHEY